MSTKTYLFYQKMAEKKEFKDANPPKTVQKSPKLMHVHKNVSYASRTGDPPVGLKTHQCSKLGHSAVVLYIILLS